MPITRRYTGAWAQKASTPTVQVPLVAAIDPEHSHPTANIDDAGADPKWRQIDSAPTLPWEYTGDAYADVVTAGGVVDMTPGQTVNTPPTAGGYAVPPNRSQLGVGVGPGLTTDESVELMGYLHEQDYGAVEARQWSPAVDRDGAPHVAVIYDTPGNGISPQTNDLKISGVGGTDDPFARTGKRIQRWYDRHIDMHRWEVTYRPAMVKNAYTAQDQPPVGDGNQYDSPFMSPGLFQVTPDSFVFPQQRENPVPWQDHEQADPLQGQIIDADRAIGVSVWGL